MIAALTWRCVTRRGSKVHLVSDPRMGLRVSKTLCGRRVYDLARAKAGDERPVSCERCREAAEGALAYETRTVAALLEGRR